jgi:hypothetical protein
MLYQDKEIFKMHLDLVIAIVGSAIAIVGVVLALFLWNRSEANSDRRDIVNLVLAIQEEMKDFHIQLALQDQDFKSRLCAIEQNRKK